ncbi:DUF2789 family protein [Colwelliaceae bacterium 6471]
MDRSIHTMSCLFAQLGLDSDDSNIQTFINEHKGLIGNQSLADAEFWNKNQAAFINEAISADSDWCEIVDTLDTLLR